MTDEITEEEERIHLEGFEDSGGCAEVWEFLSEQRQGGEKEPED